jgi:hypothetical protein
MMMMINFSPLLGHLSTSTSLQHTRLICVLKSIRIKIIKIIDKEGKGIPETGREGP